VEEKGFEAAVRRALDGLPDDFRRHLENVEVEVRGAPSGAELRSLGVEPGGTLLGAYKGVPRTDRGMGYMFVLPDTITIYKKPIEEYCRRSGVQVDEMVRKVVLHEIAHHYGISDERLRELGY
jgi:predicted Zn-dependent protease with MMP-like domain